MKKILLLLTFLTSIYSFSYAQCTPSVTIYSSPSGPICAGMAVTFTPVATNSGTAPTYQWRINGSNFPGATNTIFTKTFTSNNDIVEVVLTSNATCASPVTAVSNPIYITISNSIGAGTIGTDQTICYNTIPATITEITAPTNITGTTTYTWEISLSASGPFTAIPSASGATYTPPPIGLTQDVYIRRIITDPGSPAPCNTAASNIIHITVRPQLTAGVIGSDQTTCAGSLTATMTQTTATTGGTGIYTYQWQSDVSGSFQDIAGATSSSYTPLALTVTTRFQRVETSGICGSVTSNVVTKTVTAPEVVTVSINNPEQVCAGSSPITFTATTSSTGTGTLSYSWSLSGVIVGTNSPTFTYNPVVAGDNGKVIKVVVTTSNGCNAGPATSNVVTLDIVGAITPTVTISGNSVNCEGMQTTFRATSTGGGLTPSYQWYVTPSSSPIGTVGSRIGTDAVTFTSASLTNGDRVYVELTSSLNCIVGTNPIVSNLITMNVTPSPTLMINETYPTICFPNTFTFISTTTSINTYQWYFNRYDISGATNSTLIASQSGLYTLVARNEVCPPLSFDVILTVDPCGAFSTNITGPNPITPGQQNAVYSVTNQTGFTYTWSITGGTIVSGQNTNSVTVDWDAPTSNAFARTTATTYSISVLEKNPSNQIKTTTLNLNTTTTNTTLSQAQSGINVFPNPTTGSFNIEMPESGVAVSYEILDLTGCSVGSGTFTSTGGNQKIDADLGAGMYQVVLKYNKVVTCVRLSKVQ